MGALFSLAARWRRKALGAKMALHLVDSFAGPAEPPVMPAAADAARSRAARLEHRLLPLAEAVCAQPVRCLAVFKRWREDVDHGAVGQVRHAVAGLFLLPVLKASVLGAKAQIFLLQRKPLLLRRENARLKVEQELLKLDLFGGAGLPAGLDDGKDGVGQGTERREDSVDRDEINHLALPRCREHASRFSMVGDASMVNGGDGTGNGTVPSAARGDA